MFVIIKQPRDSFLASVYISRDTQIDSTSGCETEKRKEKKK